MNDEQATAYEIKSAKDDTWFKVILIGLALFAAYSVMTSEPTNGPLHGNPDNGICYASSGAYEC